MYEKEREILCWVCKSGSHPPEQKKTSPWIQDETPSRNWLWTANSKRLGINEENVQRIFITDVKELNKLLSNPVYPRPLTPMNSWKLRYSVKENFFNIFYKIVSSHIHHEMKPYRVLDRLGSAPLYNCTNLVIYVSDGMNDPPLGDYLGRFTDKLMIALPDAHIVELW